MVQLDCIFSHLSVMGQICSNQHKIRYNNDYRTELYIMKYQYFQTKRFLQINKIHFHMYY